MIENPYGKFEVEGTISLPEREIIRERETFETIKETVNELIERRIIGPETIREIITDLREREIITSETETQILERLAEGETITEIITDLIEKGVISPGKERQIISYLREIGVIPEIAEVPAKPIPWAWIIALGSVFTAAIVVASTKKETKKT